jgi:hypothetical protein
VVVVLVFFVPRAIVPAQAGSTIKMKEGCARMEKSPGKELAAFTSPHRRVNRAAAASLIEPRSAPS